MSNVYAKLDENNNIIEIIPKPKWLLADGSEVTDKYLIPEGYIPVDYDTLKPTIDEFYQQVIPNPSADWKVISGDIDVYIYDEESNTFVEVTKTLPYVIQVTYKITEKTLEELKEEYKQKVKEAFEHAPDKGFVSNTLGGIRINAHYIDLQNMINLVRYMEETGQSEIEFRVYDNSFVTTDLNTLKDVVKELGEYYIQLYQHKWQKQIEVDNISSIEQLKQFEVW